MDLGACFERLELERRLRETPSDAQIRGWFFRLAEQAVAQHGRDLRGVWRAATGARSRWPFRLYSAREFMREQATAAALIDPTNPGTALRHMWQETPRLSSIVSGNGFIRYLTAGDPMRALTWLESNRSMMCNYGDWWVVPTGLHSAVFHYRDEYTWIEHCHVGGVEGTLQRCGVSPVISVELDSAYSGRLRIQWS